MRPHEIFAAMSEEQSQSFFKRLADDSQMTFSQAVAGAAAAMNSRPQYLFKQPLPKQVAAVRRALSRVAARPLAEEILAVYFLECRKELLTEWLDQLGLEHEEGVLADSNPECPEQEKLGKAVETYRGQDDDPDRELLLRAFASQSAIDWPALDALIHEGKA
ncbi:MAG: hypothetical protein ACJZ7Z_12165 [Myxococcota bacterium]|nr:hypothetical protein [Spirochaeta sp.]RPG11361.1 MAG: hypothetical protein CBC32_005370 [Proteobacteria bacterium TMED72]